MNQVPIYITLTHGESHCWINVNQICGIFRHNNQTTIVTPARDFMVIETPEQVGEIIEKAVKRSTHYQASLLAANLNLRSIVESLRRT